MLWISILTSMLTFHAPTPPLHKKNNKKKKKWKIKVIKSSYLVLLFVLFARKRKMFDSSPSSSKFVSLLCICTTLPRIHLGSNTCVWVFLFCTLSVTVVVLNFEIWNSTHEYMLLFSFFRWIITWDCHLATLQKGWPTKETCNTKRERRLLPRSKQNTEGDF